MFVDLRAQVLLFVCVGTCVLPPLYITSALIRFDIYHFISFYQFTYILYSYFFCKIIMCTSILRLICFSFVGLSQSNIP